MENQSNSNDKRKSAKYLNIYSDKNTFDELNIKGIHFTPVSRKNSQLSIIKRKDAYDLRTESKSYRFNNFETIVEICNDTEPVLSEIDKSLSYRKSETLESFLKSLTQLKEIDGYNASQIFIHKKGSSVVDSKVLINNQIHNFKEEASTFNTIYSKIKKSKNKIFDQSEMLNHEIKLDGHFLAKEISLKSHNLVILISRNDLFPVSNNDRVFFNKYMSINIPRIRNIINNTSVLVASKEANKAIKNFPIDVNVEDGIANISQEHVDRLKSDTSSLHHERIMLMGELLNTLRHELSNPLFGIDLSHNLLLDASNDPETLDYLEHISTSVKRSQAIIKEFSSLYSDTQKSDSISLNNIINETVVLTKSETRAHKVIIKEQDDINIECNPTLLSQIIFNLVINSSQALINSNTVDAQISISHETKEDQVEIYICDNGPGIPDHIRDKIFTPFFTTKKTGTGLGLAICHNLIKKLNGDLNFERIEDTTVFTINLPLETR